MITIVANAKLGTVTLRIIGGGECRTIVCGDIDAALKELKAVLRTRMEKKK